MVRRCVFPAHAGSTTRWVRARARTNREGKSGRRRPRASGRGAADDDDDDGTKARSALGPWIANARGFFIVEHGDRAFGVRVGGS